METFLKRAWTEIDLDAIRHNFKAIRCAVDREAMIMAVVKADAYGHGVEHVAKELADAGADWFAVSGLSEALQLRRFGLLQPVLILGYTPPDLVRELSKNNISQAVFSPEYARRLSSIAVAEGCAVQAHIKLDTGMGRIGFSVREGGSLHDVAQVCRLPGLVTQGVFTHFPSADHDGDPGGVTNGQAALFLWAVDQLKQQGISFAIRHCCNSAAITEQKGHHMDMVRVGISLYGMAPAPVLHGALPLMPAMQLRAAVSMVKQLEAGSTVSYGRTFRTPQDITVATVSIGYADGYPRSLSNRAHMLVEGRRAPVIGRVCMDQLMLDVTGIDGVREGSVATAFGTCGDQRLSVDQLANLAGTINYEIVCLISRRVPRVYYRNGQAEYCADYLLD